MKTFLFIAITWAVLYALYALFYRKETFFKMNRNYLLLSLVAGLLLPFVQWIPAEYLNDSILYVTNLQTIVVTALPIAESSTTVTSQWYDSLLRIETIYAMITLGLLVRFIASLFQIRKLINTGSITRMGDYLLVKNEAISGPFTFLNYVFISEAYEGKELIMVHELAHVRGKHSWDSIFIEILTIFFWPTAIIFLYRNALKIQHEFLADDAVLKTSDAYQYGHLLLQNTPIRQQVSLGHGFFTKTIKKRISMMTQSKSTRQARWKYLLTIPMVAALMIFFSCKKDQVVNPEVKEVAAKTEETSKLATIVQEIVEAEKEDVMPNDPSNGGLNIVALAPDPEVVKPAKKLPPPPPPPPPVQKKDNVNEIFKVVEQMPRFPGCEGNGSEEEIVHCAQKEMLKFLYGNIKYPKIARENGVQGQVVATFVVEKDGSISGARLLRNLGAGCGEEALRVIRLMNQMPQKWIPGKQRGKDVRVQFNLPVKFRLKK